MNALIAVVLLAGGINMYARAAPTELTPPLTSEEKHGVADCKLEVGRALVGVFHQGIDNYRLEKTGLMVTCLKGQGMKGDRLHEIVTSMGEY